MLLVATLSVIYQITVKGKWCLNVTGRSQHRRVSCGIHGNNSNIAALTFAESLIESASNISKKTHEYPCPFQIFRVSICNRFEKTNVNFLSTKTYGIIHCLRYTAAQGCL
jgi:hypothetical protein